MFTRCHRCLVRLGLGLLATLGALLPLLPAARAIILYDTGDPAANTSRPAGPDGFGWDFQGQISAFLGTAIAPNFFVTAKHLGVFASGTNFFYQGANFQTTAAFVDPLSDLVIYQVNGTFASYAPLFTSAGGEAGQALYVFGRGTQRGAPINVPAAGGSLAGWGWGAGDAVQRWGQNTVSGLEGGFVEANFDAISGANEAALSTGDSGGGVFILDGGVWKLAGINYGVSGPYSYASDGSNAFLASLFDARGLYAADSNNSFQPVSGPDAVPSLFAATEIAGRLDFINSVVPEPDAARCALAGLAALLAVGVAGRRRERRGTARP